MTVAASPRSPSALVDRLVQAARARGVFSRWRHPRRYLDSLFADVDFTGRSVLEIGGGAGVISLYAACRGAREVVCLEPEADGSRAGFRRTFGELVSLMEMEDRVTLVPLPLQEYDATRTFDVVLVHNTINHLDEEACERLHASDEARAVYAPLLGSLRARVKPGGVLLVADCSRRNFWGDLGLRSPVAPSIEWRKHQTPEVWTQLLREQGFVPRSLRWSPLDRLGPLAGLTASRPAAYLTHSHFSLLLEAR